MNIITPKMMIIASSIHRNEKIKKSYEKGTCRSYNYHRKFLAGAKQSDRQCCGFVSHCPYFIRDCQGDYAGRCCQFQRNTLCRTTDGRIPLETATTRATVAGRTRCQRVQVKLRTGRMATWFRANSAGIVGRLPLP